MTTDSTPIYVPTEYLAELSEVIRIGLQEAKLKREIRKELTLWWEAEKTLIDEKVP
jgi:hypothetical protein